MNIVLSGFMGSGKTTLAGALSRELNMRSIDIDRYIEEQQGMSTNDIFAEYGEKAFRDLEHLAVKELCQKDNIIISTGGGTILNSANTKLLKRNGVVIYLDVTVETVMRRLASDHSRPLLQRDDKESAVTELLNGRLPIYKAAADVIVDANSDDISQKVKDVISKLSLDKK